MAGRIAYKTSISKNNIVAIQQESLALKDAPTTIMVALDKIKDNPDNSKIYGNIENDNIENLKESIKRNNFLGSIILFDNGDGTYEICSGHRRTRAMRELGKTSIPATIIPMPDDKNKAELLLANNLNQRNTTPIQKAREIKFYEDTHEISRGDGRMRDILASFFNISPSKVYRYLNLLELNDNLQSLVAYENFPWHALSKAKDMTDEQQDLLYERINVIGADNITGVNISELIEEICVHGEHISNNEPESVDNFTEDKSGDVENIKDSEKPVLSASEKAKDSPEPAKDRNINDYENGEIVSNIPVNKKKVYTKTETNRLKMRIDLIAKHMNFNNNDILIDKEATRQWFEGLTDLIQEMGTFI